MERTARRIGITAGRTKESHQLFARKSNIINAKNEMGQSFNCASNATRGAFKKCGNELQSDFNWPQQRGLCWLSMVITAERIYSPLHLMIFW